MPDETATEPAAAPEAPKPEPKPEALTKSPTEPPALDPTLGDKTPAYVEWLRDNKPKEFEKRYKGRKTHLSD